MKALHRIALLCCANLPLWGQAQTAQVHVAGSDYPVTFADTTLSATNRQRIASDLTTVFSLAVSFDKLKGEEAESGVFKMEDPLMFASGEDEYILIVERDDQQGIRVSKTLTDKYQQAFALVDSHSNAVQKAHEFVAMLNSTNLLSRPVDEVVQEVRHEPLEGAYALSDNAIREIFVELQQLRFPGFSALHFSIQQFPQFDGADIPVINPFFVIHKTDPSRNIATPIDFYDGKWGFGRSPW